jgi:tetratricopeptide (TPR) repeat protein
MLNLNDPIRHNPKQGVSVGEKQQEYFTILESVLKMARPGLSKELISLVDRAIALEPNLSHAYIVKGGILQQDDAFEQAEKIYRQALTIEPDNPQALQALGMLLVDLERFDEAFPLLLKHLSAQPQSGLTLDGLLTCLANYHVEELDELDILFQKAWETSHRPEIGIKYAHYLMLQKGELPKAKTILEEICNRSPNAESLAELALAYSIDGDCEKAIETLNQAVMINPDYDRLWRGLAQCYLQSEDQESANQAADRALALDPDHYRNLLAKTEVLAFSDDPEALNQALRLIEKAKDHAQIDHAAGEPEAAPVLRRLIILAGNIFNRLDQNDQAVREYQQGLRAFPDYPDFYTRLFITLFRTGKTSQAWNILPQDPPLQTILFDNLAGIAAQFFFNSQVETALEIYQGLTARAPKPEFLMPYGYVLGTAGEAQLAIKTLQEGLSQEDISEETRTISYANLAYLYVLTNAPQAACDAARTVFEAPAVDQPAILHLPFWFAGVVHADPISIPGRSILSLDAAQICYVTALLMLDEIDKALPFVPIFKSWDDQHTHKYLILASIYAQQKKQHLAEEMLSAALRFSTNKNEQNWIKNCLKIL